MNNQVEINWRKYKYYNPIDYDNYKLLKKQIKRVKEKIKAKNEGCYKNKLTKNGVNYYNDYELLLTFLETF